jgi:hypothetical protein
LPTEGFAVVVVIGNRGKGWELTAKGDGTYGRTLPAEAAHEFANEMLRLGCTPAISTCQDGATALYGTYHGLDPRLDLPGRLGHARNRRSGLGDVRVLQLPDK